MLKRTRATLPQLLEVVRRAREPWGTLFGFLLETGARYGEAAALTWDQIEPTSCGHLRVKIEPHALPSGKWWRPKRPASVRSLLINPTILSPTGTGPGLIFFPARKSPPSRSSVCEYLARLSRALNFPPVQTHDFRRARIAQALAAGADPNTVRAAVGHRTLLSTMAYLVDTPVQAALPPLDAGAVSNPLAQQYLPHFRPAGWGR